MITISITIEEKNGELKTLMDSTPSEPTHSEIQMLTIIEHDFRKRQKKLAKQTGGKFVSG
jgi:hypothetical protein